MAENVFCVTQTKKSVYSEVEESNSIAYVSSGIPMDGVGVLIKDDFGQLIESSDVGEIWIFGSSLTNGYYLMPELTDEKFIDDVYKTGDMGFMKDGELYVIGRNDDILNINGKKIVAHEIESIISDIPGVISGRCLAFSVYDIGKSGNGLGVIFEHDLADITDIKNIKKLISITISSSSSIDISELYEVERGFIVKSTSGKISRKSNITKLKSRLNLGA
jgi:acyl-CoA synthetase (AMP-forming)/AMP-acid ligase II